MILLKSLICKGLPSKDCKACQRKCLPCIHALNYFGWIFPCRVEGCATINFIDKKFPTLYCLITWNENHAYSTVYGKPNLQYIPVNSNPG